MPSHALRRVATLALALPALSLVSVAAASADEVVEPVAAVVASTTPVTDDTAPSTTPVTDDAAAALPGGTYTAFYTRW